MLEAPVMCMLEAPITAEEDQGTPCTRLNGGAVALGLIDASSMSKVGRYDLNRATKYFVNRLQLIGALISQKAAAGVWEKVGRRYLNVLLNPLGKPW